MEILHEGAMEEVKETMDGFEIMSPVVLYYDDKLNSLVFGSDIEPSQDAIIIGVEGSKLELSPDGKFYFNDVEVEDTLLISKRFGETLAQLSKLIGKITEMGEEGFKTLFNIKDVDPNSPLSSNLNEALNETRPEPSAYDSHPIATISGSGPLSGLQGGDQVG